MAVYTVHEPPQRSDAAAAHAERFAFVRDGFYFWAFLLAPLWLLRHRLWLAFIGYVVIAGALAAALQMTGASLGAKVLVSFLFALLVGFEAGSLRRWTLNRRAWKNHGIVMGDDRESAERRFFAAWAASVPASAPAAPPPSSHVGGASSSDVIGLFPQPEVRP